MRGSLSRPIHETSREETALGSVPQSSEGRAQFGRIQSNRSYEDTRNKSETSFCKKCGHPLNAMDNRCPNCDLGVTFTAGVEKRTARPWIFLASIAAVLLIVVVVSLGISRSNDNPSVATYNSQQSQQTSNPVNTPKPHIAPSATTAPTATPVQSATPIPAPKSGPGPEDMQGFDSKIVQPASTAWLSEYDIRYVQSTGGVSIYLRYGPSKDYEYFDTVKEAESVTVLAEQNGFALVIASGNRLGWCNSSLIVSGSDKIAPVPSFNETYWTYLEGQTLGTTYACLFHSNGTYSSYSYGGGTYSEGKYSLDGRRLKLGSIKFVWDGKEFVSTEKYEMQVGSDYLRLSPDPTAYYEEIKATVESWGQDPGSGTADDSLPDGRYYVELTYEEYWGDHDFITVDLLRVTGVAPSDNLIFENTGVAYVLMVANYCTIKDSSVFDDYGLTEKYYSSIGPIIQEYGFGIILDIEISNGEVVYIDKFYIA